MRNRIKLVMLGLLLTPFAMIIDLGNVYAQNFNVEIEEGSGTPGCETVDQCWDPTTITIPVGATVVWVNKDSAGHTVTSGMPGGADSGQLFDSTKDPAGFLIQPEKSWQHTFSEEGEFPYWCQVHPYMVGKIIVGGEAPPPPPVIPGGGLLLTTDNGSVNVSINIDKATIEGNMIHVDPPKEEVTMKIIFTDPATGQLLEHVNYEFHVADPSGQLPVHRGNIHVHDGIDTQSGAFPDTGSYTFRIQVLGTGINPPYDTKQSGTVSTTVMVTPEFPLGLMGIMAAVVGIAVAASRFKSPLKL